MHKCRVPVNRKTRVQYMQKQSNLYMKRKVSALYSFVPSWNIVQPVSEVWKWPSLQSYSIRLINPIQNIASIMPLKTQTADVKMSTAWFKSGRIRGLCSAAALWGKIKGPWDVKTTYPGWRSSKNRLTQIISASCQMSQAKLSDALRSKSFPFLSL